MIPRTRTKECGAQAVLAGSLWLLQACGGHVVNLDQPSVVTSSDAGATSETIALPDGVSALWVDDSRLYWKTSGYALEGCLKNDCANTVVTYFADQTIDVAIAGGHVYWSRINDAETIFSCPNSGCAGSPTRVVQDPSLGPISADGDYVYWVSAVDIYRCPYSGCGATPELVASQAKSQFKLSFQGASAFWTEDGNSLGNPPSIRQAPKDGSALPATFLQTQTFSMAADAKDLYWLEPDDRETLESCPLTGCEPDGPRTVATTSTRGDHLTVDAAGAYWLDLEPGLGNAAVRFCPLGGCGSDIQAVTPIGVIAFAVDDNYVYWSESDPHRGSYIGSSIHRASK